MTLFKRILCPIDFSENSVRALQCAEMLARECHAEMILLHVIEAPYSALSNPGFEYEHYLDGAKRRLQEFASPLKVKYESMLSTGNPATKIVALAKNLEATLIIMATRGYHGAVHKLLGSTTETVIRSSVIPVMTISPHCESLEIDRSKKVLLPISSLLRPTKGLIHLRKMLRELGRRVTLFHVVEFTDPMFDSNFHANPFLVTAYETTEKQHELETVGRVILRSETPQEAVIQFGTAGQEILRQLETGAYCMVLLQPKKKTFLSSFFGSTVYNVISAAPVPVITLKG